MTRRSDPAAKESHNRSAIVGLIGGLAGALIALGGTALGPVVTADRAADQAVNEAIREERSKAYGDFIALSNEILFEDSEILRNDAEPQPRFDVLPEQELAYKKRSRQLSAMNAPVAVVGSVEAAKKAALIVDYVQLGDFAIADDPRFKDPFIKDRGIVIMESLVNDFVAVVRRDLGVVAQ